MNFFDETPVTPSNTHKVDENQIEKHIPKRTRRNHSDGRTTEPSAEAASASASAKKSTQKRRLGEATTKVVVEYACASISITNVAVHLIITFVIFP